MDWNYVATLLDVIHKGHSLQNKLGTALANQATAELQALWDAPPVEAVEEEEE